MECDVFLVDGIPYVLEANARFGVGYPFSHMGGCHLPKAIGDWVNGNTVDKNVISVKTEITGYGTMSRKRTHKIDKFNALNNNYSHIDLAIHNRNDYEFVLCCRMFQYIRNTNHMHDHNHKSKYDLTILF